MSKTVVTATWDDVPHLSDNDKQELLASIPPYQRDARSKGIPQLGSGAIYPIAESELLIDPIEIPVHWQRAYGLDVGWRRTAAIWGAHDPETDTLYLYAEYYRSEAEPAVHAAAIRARGEWIPGVIDPASRGRDQVSGRKLMQEYVDLGLKIQPADNAVEAGLFGVYQRMTTGRLKVFKTLQNWLMEYRLYRRDDNGKIVKENDHLMDATRYLERSGLQCACVNPALFERKAQKMPRRDTDYDPIEAAWPRNESRVADRSPFD